MVPAVCPAAHFTHQYIQRTRGGVSKDVDLNLVDISNALRFQHPFPLILWQLNHLALYHDTK